jgi:hypothetical protein
MNASLDGTLSLTKREQEILEKAPLLAAQIALHRPAIKAQAEALGGCCKNILAAIEKPQATN